MHARTSVADAQDNGTPETNRQLPAVGRPVAWLALSAASLAAFLFLLVLVERHLVRSDDRALELDVHHVLGLHDFPVFSAVSTIGGTAIHGLIVLVVTVLLFMWRYRWSAAFLLVGQIGAIAGQIVKDLTTRPRPHLFSGALHAAGYSFPSGHALSATVLYGSLAYLVWVHWRERRVVGFVAPLLAIWALIIGLSRIVLGVHYPTDVEGGIALGLAWLYATIAFFGPAVRLEAHARAE